MDNYKQVIENFTEEVQKAASCEENKKGNVNRSKDIE